MAVLETLRRMRSSLVAAPPLRFDDFVWCGFFPVLTMFAILARWAYSGEFIIYVANYIARQSCDGLSAALAEASPIWSVVTDICLAPEPGFRSCDERLAGFCPTVVVIG